MDRIPRDFQMPTQSDRSVANEVFNKRVYAKARIGFDVRAGELWLDVGANCGAFSRYVIDRGGTVEAYEPVPRNVALWRQNVRSSRAVIMETAVAQKSGPIVLRVDVQNYQRTGRWNRRGQATKVPGVAFADLLQGREHLNVKMDIEGCEYDIIVEPQEWWRVDKLVFEYHFLPRPELDLARTIVNELSGAFPNVWAGRALLLPLGASPRLWTWFPDATNVFCWR